MNFYTEERAFYVKNAKETLEFAKGQAESAKNAPQNSAIVWELATLIESILEEPYLSWGSRNALSLSMRPVTIDGYDLFFEAVEDMLLDYGFTLDLDHESPSYLTSTEYVYRSPEIEQEITLIISASQCTSYKTGKMIPETKSSCSVIK